MSKLAGLYVLYPDMDCYCIASGEVVPLALPGAAVRQLRAGYYDLDMRYIGTDVEDVIELRDAKEIESKCQ